MKCVDQIPYNDGGTLEGPSKLGTMPLVQFETVSKFQDFPGP